MNIGDLVYLKGFLGNVLTVIKIEDGKASVVWFTTDKTLHGAILPLEALEPL